MSKLHPGFTLAQLIESTADELRTVRNKAVTDPVMSLERCELELAVKVSAEVGGKVKYWFIEADAKGAAETASKVTLTFAPVGTIASLADVPGTLEDPGPKATKD